MCNETNGWGHLEGCPYNESKQEQPTELEEALQEAWKQKTAKWRVEERLEAKNLRLAIIINVLETMDGKDYLINELKKVIEL